MLGSCLVMCFLLQEGGTGCFTLIVVWLSVFCIVHHGVMGWSVVCDCGITSVYLLSFILVNIIIYKYSNQ